MPKHVKSAKKRLLGFTNVRKISLRGKKWGPESKSVQIQAIAPRDRLLSKKLGIQPKAKVLVMAGYFGDWARALSKFCEVRYTDLSSSMTEFAKRDKAKVRSFTSRPAELLVRKPKIYDWSFLFEPFPIQRVGINLVFLRSLLNRKGCKVVERLGSNEVFLQVVEQFKRLYSARATARVLKIRGVTDLKGKPLYLPISVLTLHTNKAARKKAVLDLKLLHYLTRAAKNNKAMRIEEICKKLGVSRKELEESRQRMHKLSVGLSQEKQDTYLR